MIFFYETSINMDPSHKKAIEGLIGTAKQKLPTYGWLDLRKVEEILLEEWAKMGVPIGLGKRISDHLEHWSRYIYIPPNSD